MIVLRKRGYPFERIANALGMAYGTARAIFLTGGKPPAGRSRHSFWRTPKDVVARILALRREGSSHAYIADAVGVSSTTVGRFLRSNGFPGKIPLQRLAGPVVNGCEGFAASRIAALDTMVQVFALPTGSNIAKDVSIKTANFYLRLASTVARNFLAIRSVRGANNAGDLT